MNRIRELVDWLQGMPADFAFLLALPFVVGAAGLWAERRGRRGAQPPTPVPGPERIAQR